MIGSAARADDRKASPTVVRVAAVSFMPVKFDLQGNAKRLETLFRKASAGGARIAVSPEAALDGFIVNDIIAGEVKAERMKSVALFIDDPLIKRFQALACELKICLVISFAERIGDEVFNCAAFIDDEGAIRGKYHKMQFAEGYHPSWWFNRLGKQSRAFDTPYGRCGMMICNDRWNERLARVPALDGAQFLVIPSYGSCTAEQDENVLSRGKENGIPVIEANVGVTLLVSDNKIVAVDRNEEGITFGEITIPPARDPNVEERDRVEQEFLRWREGEMQLRYDRRMKQLRQKSSD